MVGFREFVEHLDPCLRIPSRKTIKGTGFRDLSNEVIIKMKSMLKKVPFVNVSVDGWSDAILRSFNGYTAQGIDDDWNLVNIPIGFQYVEGK